MHKDTFQKMVAVDDILSMVRDVRASYGLIREAIALEDSTAFEVLLYLQAWLEAYAREEPQALAQLAEARAAEEERRRQAADLWQQFQEAPRRQRKREQP